MFVKGFEKTASYKILHAIAEGKTPKVKGISVIGLRKLLQRRGVK